MWVNCSRDVTTTAAFVRVGGELGKHTPGRPIDKGTAVKPRLDTRRYVLHHCCRAAAAAVAHRQLYRCLTRQQQTRNTSVESDQATMVVPAATPG